MRLALLAVLCTALVALSAAPALAQDAIAIGGGDATGGNVQYVDCSQVQNAAQTQYGDATAIGDGATAAIANEQNITQDQVNACLGEPGQNADNPNNGREDNPNNKGNSENEGKNGNETEAGKTDNPDDVLSDTIPAGTLPDTGGPSLLALLAGTTLVATGASLIGFGVRR